MSAIPQNDRDVLRQLGREIAEAAADPINETRRAVGRAVGRMEQGKPLIRIYQEPWNELNGSGELDCHCEDAFCRGIEVGMRQQLFKWRHYPGDMTIGVVSVQPYCIRDTGFGISEDVDVARTDDSNSVVSRHFHIQIKDEADIAKIKKPVVSHDAARTQEGYQKRCEIFDGILQVRTSGVGGPWFAPWDYIVRWTGVQEILMDLVLRPDYVHKLVAHLVDCWSHRLDQLVEQDLLAAPLDQLEVSGAAQIFSEVSPEMHGEFALQHEAKFMTRYGRCYYGCCEPLHDKVDVCAEYLPNMYKISMSPWVDFEKAVANVGSRFVFAWKPNPAFLAPDRWDPELVRKDIREKLQMASAGGCVMEIHLKDISTVRYEPQRLTEWNQIAQECAEEYV
ncbi:MAG: hypothetical protein HN742_28435 [Lentisphaerae bacterium]|jgi:hypothetical protein|nr:hypothetical protein [Lentisphaerota bacterium]MBT4814707.1 hypothetical protein [Lentisphaerota bacterium]MBT5611789.1 hypothetical protein [Lentisphaerota bacterium]MBT7056945.1 hypothetical protein [Lentisphaerota bacterium]MBT7845835.1 hypothetical protein [Lentisphaerota bacterium]